MAYTLLAGCDDVRGEEDDGLMICAGGSGSWFLYAENVRKLWVKSSERAQRPPTPPGDSVPNTSYPIPSFEDYHVHPHLVLCPSIEVKCIDDLFSLGDTSCSCADDGYSEMSSGGGGEGGGGGGGGGGGRHRLDREAEGAVREDVGVLTREGGF
jgi:hypothetical protein